MSTLALSLWFVYFLIAFVLRMLVQLRTARSTGWVASRNRFGSLEWNVACVVLLGFVVSAAGAVIGVSVDGAVWLKAAGIGAYGVGVVMTFVAQLDMGKSWRVGIDQSERTAIVVDGLFRMVRNPIYSGMLLTAAGLSVVTLSWLSFSGLALTLTALELQVRLLEEPYLARVHGAAYWAYAERTGRFVPFVGRVREPRAT